MKSLITIEDLKKLFSYDPNSGIFIRLVQAGAKGIAGQIGKTKDKDGYPIVTILGRRYYLHRLAWFYMYGEWPKNQIDHINGIRDDNRIANLRDVICAINSQNRKKALSKNPTGFLGVYKLKSGRYQSALGINGKIKYFGVYSSPEEAYRVTLSAKRKYHPGCTI